MVLYSNTDKLTFNSLPDDKILPLSKLKAFADNKFIVDEMLQFLRDRVENIMGKAENTGFQHFELFSQCFQKASISGS